MTGSRGRDAAPRAAILWVSTSRCTRGGIASYVTVMAGTPLWTRRRIRHVVSHVEGARTRQVAVFARAWAQVVGSLLGGRVALLHLHTASSGSFVRKAVLLWTATAFGVPAVLHVHGGGFAAFRDARAAPLQALIRRTLERAAGVVVLGRSWSEEIARIAPRARCTVLGNPVEPAEQTDPSVPRVVCLGRMGPAKGTDDLLEAWAAMGGEHPEAELVLAGDGEVRASRARAGAADLEGRVTVREWVPRAEALALLDTATVFVLPSYAEGQPMAVLEAMARGVCVVASDVGGIPDLVHDGETGLLVPPGDRAALRTALHRVLADPQLRARLGRAGRELARAEHDPRVLGGRLDALYRELGPG